MSVSNIEDVVKEIDQIQPESSVQSDSGEATVSSVSTDLTGAVFHVEGNVHVGVGDINVSRYTNKGKKIL